MITYDLSLERQNLIGADKFSIAAESNETVSFRFHFDRNWRVFSSKAAVFKSSRGKYYVLDINSSSVQVPWEVLRDTGGFELAVVAYENEAVLTSKKVRVSVSGSLLPEFCRQLSPTETIFDRFRTEARNEAFLEYRDEIAALNHTHANELIELNGQIAAEQANTEAVRAQKDAEIAQLNYAASVAQNSHNAAVAALQAQIEANAEKAHNWELVNTALSKKPSLANQLWTEGTENYELPMLDLSSVAATNNVKIDTKLTKIGLHIPSLTSIYNLCSSRTQLIEIDFSGTESILSAESVLSGCSALKRADMGNLSVCQNLRNAFSNCKSVEYISLGNPNRLVDVINAFNNCFALKEINGIINSALCTDYSGTFYSCTSLEEVRFAENAIRKTIDFSYCVNLSKESIYNIAAGLFSETPYTVYFSNHAFTTNLTAEEREEITDLIRNEKGWNLTVS